MTRNEAIAVIGAATLAALVVIGGIMGVTWLNNQPETPAKPATTVTEQTQPDTAEPSLRNVTAAIIDCAEKIGDPGPYVVSAYAEIIQTMIEQGPEAFAATAAEHPSCDAAVQYLFLPLKDQT